MSKEDVLIEQLYTSKECEIIRSFYTDDPSSKLSIREAISTKLITDSTKIVINKPIDVLYLICLSAKFASSEEECHTIAITVYQFYNKVNEMLPCLATDRGLGFANKALMSLAFRPQALEKKWKYHGAPKPSFYRELSKSIFKMNEQQDIASHHEQWETFLGEIFV